MATNGPPRYQAVVLDQLIAQPASGQRPSPRRGSREPVNLEPKDPQDSLFPRMSQSNREENDGNVGGVDGAGGGGEGGDVVGGAGGSEGGGVAVGGGRDVVGRLVTLSPLARAQVNIFSVSEHLYKQDLSLFPSLPPFLT